MSPLRARLARKPPGYQFTIGRILAIYAGLMVTCSSRQMGRRSG